MHDSRANIWPVTLQVAATQLTGASAANPVCSPRHGSHWPAFSRCCQRLMCCARLPAGVASWLPPWPVLR